MIIASADEKKQLLLGATLLRIEDLEDRTNETGYCGLWIGVDLSVP
jgi:hypothetical protein